MDFKNRTTYDLLKLELSGIRRQNSQSKDNTNKGIVTRSKSRENKKLNKTDKGVIEDHSVRHYNEILSQCLADRNKPI